MINYNNVLKAFQDKQMKKPAAIFLPDATRYIAENLELIYSNNLINSSKTLANITNPNLKALIKLLYLIPRSTLLATTAKYNPRYASLTPIALYAHKFYNQIPYEHWDKSDDKLNYFLGKYLSPLITQQHSSNFTSKYPTIAEVATYRSIILQGQSVTSFTVKKLLRAKSKSSEHQPMALPKVYAQLLLQTWIAHSSLRVPDAMILDPFDWDNCPLAYD